MVALGSGRGISVSENSAAGIKPSVFWPMSTTTPCSVYAITLTSRISLFAGASCCSSYWSRSLLISSVLAASSAAAAASASVADCAAWASALACTSAASGEGATGASAFASSCVAGACASATGASGAASSCDSVACGVFTGVASDCDSWAGAAAAALTGLSWSENMVVGLREISPKLDFWLRRTRNEFGHGRARVIDRLPCRLPVGGKARFQGMFLQTLNKQGAGSHRREGRVRPPLTGIANQLYRTNDQLRGHSSDRCCERWKRCNRARIQGKMEVCQRNETSQPGPLDRSSRFSPKARGNNPSQQHGDPQKNEYRIANSS